MTWCSVKEDFGLASVKGLVDKDRFGNPRADVVQEIRS